MYWLVINKKPYDDTQVRHLQKTNQTWQADYRLWRNVDEPRTVYALQ